MNWCTQLQSLMSPRWQKRCMRSCRCQWLSSRLSADPEHSSCCWNWTFISSLLGKEGPRIMQWPLSLRGTGTKIPKVWIFSFLPPLSLLTFIWACVFGGVFFFLIYQDLMHELRLFISCTSVCQELTISPNMSGIDNITKNSFKYLWGFPFVSNVGCCYRCIIEVEITTFSHWREEKLSRFFLRCSRK